MIRVTLPPAEAERLAGEFDRADDCKYRGRLQIVLMAHRGRAYQDIAADVGVNRRTVTRWVNVYLDGGRDALRPRTARGATPKIPASMADDSKRWEVRPGRRARPSDRGRRGVRPGGDRAPGRKNRLHEWMGAGRIHSAGSGTVIESP